MSTEISLHYFIIFNPKLGQREGTEHEKILFCYPQTISIGEQTNSVGLTEGYILCTRQFSPEKPVEFIHTMKTTITIHSPEPDIWIMMSVNNPAGPLNKDGKTREYIEDETDEFILKRIVKQVYSIWTLFNGTILPKSNYSKDKDTVNYESLRRRLDSFLRPYIQQIPFDQLDLFMTLDGIRFLPVNKNIYFNTITYFNSIECNFQSTIPSLQSGLILYKDHVIWSSLDLHDSRILYHYLVNLLKFGSDSSTNTIPMMILNNNGEPQWYSKARKTGFINIDNGSIQQLPTAYQHDKDKQSTMIIYEQKDIIVVFFIDPKDLELLKFDELSAALSNKLEFIRTVLEENYIKRTFFDEQYKYIYFNQMNLAIRSSIKSKSSELTKDIIKILNDIHYNFETSQENITETTIKTQSDRWIVAKKIDFREFYFIFDNKNATLTDIDEEVKNINKIYFQNLFID